MSRTSVDPIASLDELKGNGWEPSYTPDPMANLEPIAEPEMKVSCVDTMRLLQEINRARPLALNVLLDSAIDRMTMYETAGRLHISARTVTNHRAWLAEHHPALAACLNNPS